MIFGNVLQNHWDLLAHWQYPDSSNHEYLPELDLNNLFRWAVPKISRIHGIGRNTQMRLVSGWGDMSGDYGAEIVEMGKRLYLAFNQDPALALFWAIYQLIEEKK